MSNTLKLETQLRALLGHDQIVVSSHGGHLLIKLLEDGAEETVARLSEIRPNLYIAGFKTHKGKWEPLPGEGNLSEMAELVVDMLRPYLENYF
jgi:hypothetical protein